MTTTNNYYEYNKWHDNTFNVAENIVGRTNCVWNWDEIDHNAWIKEGGSMAEQGGWLSMLIHSHYVQDVTVETT